jgi:hypothetical protein
MQLHTFPYILSFSSIVWATCVSRDRIRNLQSSPMTESGFEKLKIYGAKKQSYETYK